MWNKDKDQGQLDPAMAAFVMGLSDAVVDVSVPTGLRYSDLADR